MRKTDGRLWLDPIPENLREAAVAALDASDLIGFLIKATILITKSILLVIVQIWVRWTFPRVRLDQMMHVCWKVLLPISLVCLVGSTLWELASGGSPFFGIPALLGIGT